MCEGMERDKAYCRNCGGQRWHYILAKEDVRWDDEESPVSSLNSWQILKCAGCDTITFRHVHWFSEEIDDDDAVVIHKDHYPPAPARTPPEWSGSLWRYIDTDNVIYVWRLMNDIYSAMGLKAYALSAMGIRAIVDWLATETVDDGEKPFKVRLNKMLANSHITQERHDTIYTAFDAGSAAAHRQHLPTEEQVSTMLDIMERLFYDLKVKAHDDAEEVKASEKLKKSVPKTNNGKP